MCKEELPKYNLTKYETLCQDLAKDLVDVIPDINNALGVGLAWDVPKGFCSVFIPVCSQPCCSDDTPTQPQQRHLSLTHDPAEMAVTWVTLRNTTTSTVQWGPVSALDAADGQFPFSADGAGNLRTYTNGGWVGSIHTAVMTNLKAGTTYQYRVGDASGGWSDTVTFSTFPEDIGTTDRPLRMVQIGDTGWGDESNETVATLTSLAESGKIDMVLHVGDIGAARACVVCPTQNPPAIAIHLRLGRLGWHPCDSLWLVLVAFLMFLQVMRMDTRATGTCTFAEGRSNHGCELKHAHSIVCHALRHMNFACCSVFVFVSFFVAFQLPAQG